MANTDSWDGVTNVQQVARLAYPSTNVYHAQTTTSSQIRPVSKRCAQPVATSLKTAHARNAPLTALSAPRVATTAQHALMVTQYSMANVLAMRLSVSPLQLAKLVHMRISLQANARNAPWIASHAATVTTAHSAQPSLTACSIPLLILPHVFHTAHWEPTQAMQTWCVNLV